MGVEQKIIENHKVLANRLKRMKRKMKRMERKSKMSIDVDTLKDELASCERRLANVWKDSPWYYVDDGGASAEREEHELEGQIELLRRLIEKAEGTWI